MISPFLQVSINMYPVTSAAVLADDTAALALVTANSHACTSMADGAIELTLNRNVVDKAGTRFTGNRPVHHTLYYRLAKFKTSNCSGQRGLSSALPVI